MKSKILGLFGLSMFIVAMFMVSVSAAALAEWSLTTDGVATNVNSNVDDGDLAFGSTLTTTGFSTDGATATGWNLFSLGTNDYYEIALSPNVGFSMTINSISFDQISSNSTTNMSFDVEWSTDGFVTSTNIGSAVVSTTSSTSFSDTSTINVAEGKTFNLRVFGYGSDNHSTETFSVKDLILDGTVIPTSSFCSDGARNDDDLRLKVDINNRGEGDDEEWLPLDLIEIEVELENDKNLDDDGDLNDVVFELGLFREGSSSNIIDDMMWISSDDEEVEVGDIDEDEKESFTFEFRVDPREVEDDDYVLRVKAYEDGDEEVTCIDYSEDLTDFGSSKFFADIQVSKENDKEKMVVVDEDSYPLVTNAFCGEQVSLSVDVYNIGDKDFDDQIKVMLFNSELGINEEVIASGDFDEGDKADVTFLFRVPADAQEKTYTLSMETFYDYDKDDDQYDEVSEDTFTALLRVEGNCGAVSEASVSANLESGGKAGEELVVRATVTNTGDTEADYLVNAAGYSLWASSANVNPTSFTLNSGQSRDVLITLNVRDDASGDELFSIEVLSGNELAAIQPVSVLIEGNQGGFLTGGVIGAFSGGNSYLWLLGLLNVILVMVIIVVAVRVLRK